jgi:hypothetical protein
VVQFAPSLHAALESVQSAPEEQAEFEVRFLPRVQKSEFVQLVPVVQLSPSAQ